MSFKQVIKVPASTQNCVGSILGCYQQNQCQVNLQNSLQYKNSQSISSPQKNKDMLKRTRFWKNDSIYNYIHQMLIQNINSLNTINKVQVHDYSQVQCEQFIHSLNLNYHQEGNWESCHLSQIQTVQSQYFASGIEEHQSTSLESDNESCFSIQYLQGSRQSQ